MSESLDEALRRCAGWHDHLCPRQVLGARMALLAGARLGLELPRDDKRLIAFVETDGCFADGVMAASGCTMGHRTLRLIDHGKVAATFVDARTESALRLAPRPGIRDLACAREPGSHSRWHAQLASYQRMTDQELLVATPVALIEPLSAYMSRPGLRVACQACGEEIINGRQRQVDGRLLCRACAGQGYVRAVED